MSLPANPTSPTATADITVVLVHGAFADASGWSGVIAGLQQRGHVVVAPPNPLRGLVYVAGFAPDEGELLGAVESGSKDSVLNSALVPRHYPTGPAGQTATEFGIDPAKFHDAFAADLPAELATVMAATQRPIAEAAFTDPSGPRPGSAAVLGGGGNRRPDDRHRPRPPDGRAGRCPHPGARGLARDHDLPAGRRARGDRHGAPGRREGGSGPTRAQAATGGDGRAGRGADAVTTASGPAGESLVARRQR
jgi:hypothetical protein